MSNPAGDDASRLSAALEQVLRGADREPVGTSADAGWAAQLDDDDRASGPAVGAVDGGASVHGDHHGHDEFEMPEIVPATVEMPTEAASGPQLPHRPARPAPAVVPLVAGPAPAGAVTGGAAANPAPPVTSWGDHVPTPSARPSAQLRAPGRRPRVRRVTRVVRHVDPWSVFKVALVFSFVGYLVALTSGVLLWRVAESTGTLDNVERWFTQFGWETFELDGREIFGNAWVIGLFGAVGLTGAAVLIATLFNLVSDIVGGVRVTVLEEEVVERTASSTRRYVVRRPPLAGTAAPAAWVVDDEQPVDAGTRSPVTPAGRAEWSVDDDPTP